MVCGEKFKSFLMFDIMNLVNGKKKKKIYYQKIHQTYLFLEIKMKFKTNVCSSTEFIDVKSAFMLEHTFLAVYQFNSGYVANK